MLEQIFYISFKINGGKQKHFIQLSMESKGVGERKNERVGKNRIVVKSLQQLK